MHILFNRPDLDLQTVFLLDQVQKGRRLTADAVSYLRKNKLVEGRATNLYLSFNVATSVEQEAQYIKNKGFDDKYYKDMIVQYIKKCGKAKKRDIRSLLIDKLPESLSDKQKESKVSNLLTSLRMAGVIETDSSNPQLSNWILKK